MVFTQSFSLTDIKDHRLKVLNFLNRFSTFCMLENAGANFREANFDILAGAGIHRSFTLQAQPFAALEDFLKTCGMTCFGHFGYGLKDLFFNLSGGKPDETGFGLCSFFEPQILLHLSGEELTITSHKDDCAAIFEELCVAGPMPVPQEITKVVTPSFADYKKNFDILKAHIQRGNFYEVNYCEPFRALGAIDPVQTYVSLTATSPMPFAALYRQQQHYCICASPERYIQRQGSRLMSKPMKGTAARHSSDAGQDIQNKNSLQTNPKERAENIIVVDLVRNDLSRVALPGSVKVDELCGVYSFPTVHQMISTVSCRVSEAEPLTEIIGATFPMGSMTGAPKKIVLQTIDELEQAGRGLFSGSIGYVLPNGDFDFNVVIRSIFYNAQNHNSFFMTGGAITALSNVGQEYDEMMLKAQNMLKILTI